LEAEEKNWFCLNGGNIMANLFSILFIILVAIVGGIPTIVITGYIPVMIAQKVYRKVKYGYSLYR